MMFPTKDEMLHSNQEMPSLRQIQNQLPATTQTLVRYFGIPFYKIFDTMWIYCRQGKVKLMGAHWHTITIEKKG